MEDVQVQGICLVDEQVKAAIAQSGEQPNDDGRADEEDKQTVNCPNEDPPAAQFELSPDVDADEAVSVSEQTRPAVQDES